VTADASVLYNEGTAALARGQIGEAVAFLVAARRIDPRAADARRNLAIAERTVASAQGETPPPTPKGPAVALSSAEAWWLAAILLALGAAAVIGSLRAWPTGGVREARTFRGARLARIGGVAAVVAGVLLGAWLGAAALTERRNPEAVIVARSVEARSGVDETPRAPILLRAGERVRTGRIRGEDVEVLLGGSPIGWVPRAALWNVADTPRYTGRLRSK